MLILFGIEKVLDPKTEQKNVEVCTHDGIQEDISLSDKKMLRYILMMPKLEPIGKNDGSTTTSSTTYLISYQLLKH